MGLFAYSHAVNGNTMQASTYGHNQVTTHAAWPLLVILLLALAERLPVMKG